MNELACIRSKRENAIDEFIRKLPLALSTYDTTILSISLIWISLVGLASIAFAFELMTSKVKSCSLARNDSNLFKLFFLEILVCVPSSTYSYKTEKGVAEFNIVLDLKICFDAFIDVIIYHAFLSQAAVKQFLQRLATCRDSSWF